MIAAFGRILADPLLSEGSRAALLSLPGLAELEDAADQPDPPALFAALLALQRRFGEALAEPLEASLERCRPAWPLAWPGPPGSGPERQVVVLEAAARHNTPRAKRSGAPACCATRPVGWSEFIF